MEVSEMKRKYLVIERRLTDLELIMKQKLIEIKKNLLIELENILDDWSDNSEKVYLNPIIKQNFKITLKELNSYQSKAFILMFLKSLDFKQSGETIS